MVLTVLIVAFSLFAVLSYESSIGTAQPATCIKDRCFCEAPSLTGLMQPADRISSLAFVVAGILAVFALYKFSKKTKERRLVFGFAIILIFVGMSSFFYHGTLSYLGQFLDVFSMYLFAILLFCGALIRRGSVSIGRAIILFIVLNIIFGLLQYYIPDARRVFFGLLLLPGLLLEQQPRTTGYPWFSKPVRFFYLGIAVLTTAYVFWILDESNVFCLPRSIIQGHALWHIFTAIGAYMVIIHYRRTLHLIHKSG
jgi:predicted membrane channel-forming protein YqfA (hemolysin III family)